ncbi:MAG: sulfatase [Limisphaerales bacterium]
MKLILTTILCGLVSGLTSHAAGKTRPNILFVLADDWGRHASCYRNPARPSENDVIHTPHIDRVAREGMLFNNAFVSVSSCTPSRASIATGCHFWRTGKTAFHTTDPGWDNVADPGAALPGFGAQLQRAGYFLTSSGKTLSPWVHRNNSLGLPSWYPALDIPIKENVGLGKYVRDHHVDRDAALKAFERMTRGNVQTVLEKARENKAPFCHIFGPVGTHRGFVKGSGKALWGLDPDSFKGKLPAYLDLPPGWEDMSDALGEVLTLDQQVGWIVDELEKAGALEHTLLVLAGDNGINIPRGKAQVYEHSVHAPLIIRWGAGLRKPGRVVDDFVSLIDLAPTFLEAAGLKSPQGMDGRSLLPLLQSEKSGQIDPARDAVIVGRERHETSVRPDNSPYPVRAIRTKDFEYVRNFKPERWPCGDPSDRSFPGDPLGRGGIISWIVAHRDEPSVRPVFDLCYGKRPAEELYDLREDPFMMKNIAADPSCAETKRELSERLMKVLHATNDPRLDDAFDRPPYLDPAGVRRGGKNEKKNVR